MQPSPVHGHACRCRVRTEPLCHQPSVHEVGQHRIRPDLGDGRDRVEQPATSGQRRRGQRRPFAHLRRLSDAAPGGRRSASPAVQSHPRPRVPRRGSPRRCGAPEAAHAGHMIGAQRARPDDVHGMQAPGSAAVRYDQHQARWLAVHDPVHMECRHAGGRGVWPDGQQRRAETRHRPPDRTRHHIDAAMWLLPPFGPDTAREGTHAVTVPAVAPAVEPRPPQSVGNRRAASAPGCTTGRMRPQPHPGALRARRGAPPSADAPCVPLAFTGRGAA